MATTHRIRGGGGLNLHVGDWGNPDGRPILFIHGWSQSHLCWMKQINSPLAAEFRLVALDIRGHGLSDAPLDAEHYNDSRLWADDLAAIIKQLELDRPVLTGWSYGGYIICDYIRAYGQAAIAGVNFVGAAVVLDERSFGTLIGPGFLDHFEAATVPDLETNIKAMRGFLRACFATQPPQDEFETALAWNIVVPARVRGHLGARDIDSDDVLRTLTVPLLVTHGRNDRVILPAMGEHILSLCPSAQASWYDAVGHAPFIEDPTRFNSELAVFARGSC